jgi:hypothetical protein
MVQATADKVRALCERDLSDFDAWVLVIDGIRVGGSQVIAVLGVDSSGTKRFLGFREGSSENSRVCMDLLHDLVRRKLSLDHPILVVMDGSPALHCAIEEVVGAMAQMSRATIFPRVDQKHSPLLQWISDSIVRGLPIVKERGYRLPNGRCIGCSSHGFYERSSVFTCSFFLYD